ncbi:MAG: hypothetical protein AB8H79_04340 [Myxococcota bacterium]
MWLMFAWLGMAIATETPPELPDSQPPPPAKARRSTEDLAQRLQAARDLRTAGIALGVGGPVVGLSGLAVIAWSEDGAMAGGRTLGAVMGSAGIVSVVAAPWLLVASSSTARSVTFQTHGRSSSAATEWAVAGLTVGSMTFGTIALSLPPNRIAEVSWAGTGGVVLYVAALTIGIQSSGRNIRTARIPPPQVNLGRTPDGTWTVHLGARF